MKFIYTLLIIVLTGQLSSCSTDQKPDVQSMIGRWQLQKEEKSPNTEKGIQYKDQPTKVILQLQENGYFILYDTFVDPNWKKKGLPLIHERSKGQWELKGSNLSLNHSGDDAHKEELEITENSDHSLIMKGKGKHANVYKTYGK